MRQPLLLPLRCRCAFVYGDGSYGGTSLMRGMAGLPWRIPVPGDGDFAFTPIHARDLAKVVRLYCEEDRFAAQVLELVGPETLDLKTMLIASVGRMVVKADWIFTGTSGVVQPISEIALAHLAGWPLDTSWLVITYGLYVLAFACWAPVVWLQIKAQRLAQHAADTGGELGADYRRTMLCWFLLGWPAFLALIAVYWLMIAKPELRW